MATTPPKLLRALVDFYQGGTKVYAAGNVYPESDALLLMKARGEAEVPKPTAKPKATKAGSDTGDKADSSTADASQSAEPAVPQADPASGEASEEASPDTPQS